MAAVLRIEVTANTASARSALKGLGSDVSGASKGWATLKNAAKVAVVAGAAAAVKFGVDSVRAFKQVGGEAISLQRVMGGTIEDASRLGFAARQSGIGADVLQRSVGLLSKNLNVSSAAGQRNIATLEGLGANVRDATGALRPLGQVIPEISDVFARMPNGAEKTALAMQLFGRSGAQLLPFLNRGAAGLAELGRESDRLGMTVSGKQVQAIRDATRAQREWSATITGLKVQVGAALLPVINSLVGIFRDALMPVIVSLGGIFRDNAGTISAVATVIGFALRIIATTLATTASIIRSNIGVILPLAAAFGVMAVALNASKIAYAAYGVYVNIVTVATKLAAAAQAIWNAVLAANPIVLVVIALAALVAAIVIAYQKSETFRAIVQAAFQVLQAVVTATINGAMAVLRAFAAGVSVVANLVGAYVRTMVNIVAAYGRVIFLPFTIAFQLLRAIVTGNFGQIIGIFKSIPGQAAGALGGLLSAITAPFRNALNAAMGVVRAGVNAIMSVIRPLSGAVSGAISAAKGVYNGFARVWNAVGNVSVSVPSNPITNFLKIGGKGFSFGLPRLPMLASGAYVTGPGLAMLGEAGAEFVLPETMLVRALEASSAPLVAEMRAVEATIRQWMPAELIVVDADGQLVGRMDVAARNAIGRSARELRLAGMT